MEEPPIIDLFQVLIDRPQVLDEQKDEIDLIHPLKELN